MQARRGCFASGFVAGGPGVVVLRWQGYHGGKIPFTKTRSGDTRHTLFDECFEVDIPGISPAGPDGETSTSRTQTTLAARVGIGASDSPANVTAQS